MPTFRSIDPATLPKHFDAPAVEERLAERWARDGVYRFDPSRPRSETFVVDTPPPTVSGSLHVGHVFSFTQPDVIVRYQRMRGRNIYYPMGWDDNGLPTERRVQNYFHVRVDVTAPHEPGLTLDQATPERAKQPPRSVSRPDFIELCHKVTAEDERAFQRLFTRLGLSVDWGETYATIDDRCRTLAQLSFLDLHARGELYSSESPTMWDVDFQTAIAQAEVEDRPHAGAMHDIAFSIQGGGEFTIATTRPELLPACVGVTAHPDDERYQHLIGKRAITPLFAAPVPIFASDVVDREKGTGILMVCTFGDQTDVAWWREQRLPLRQVLGKNGRLAPITFGDGESVFASADAAAANEAYGKLAGKNVKQARAAVVEMLRASGALRGEPKALERPVKFFEKGDQPLELITTRQWFVKLLDKIDALLDFGARVQWHPPFMGKRYESWTKNLQLDWCVSRQRFFGVQIPVWYPLDERGRADHDHPILPPKEMLPIDPTVDVPPGFAAEQRGAPGGFAGETDVFDTWFTSSLTPQIGSHWLMDPARHPTLFPADIRPQSHEIIRTWAFYTIAKAMIHDGSVPWHHALISGWILDPDRKKMSKSRGNVVTPMHLLDTYSSDAVRYWAAGARLGTDTAFDDKVFAVGKRLVTKIYNAAKYVLQQTADVHPITHELDRAFAAQLAELVAAATAELDAFDYAGALARTEQFFWSQFTDAYIELVKGRARGDGDATPEQRGSGVATARLALSTLLRLFAPTLPYVTEEVWSWAFAADTGHPSIHRAPWPTAGEAGVAAPRDPRAFAIAAAAFTAVNKAKTQQGASGGRAVTALSLAANASTHAALAPVLGDVLLAVRAPSLTPVERADLPDGAFEVVELTVAPRTAD
ncbi:MAG: valine--tRNA ligase [Deltaproteobacteria bacterium]|nr:valine--tRNA ligase [Deltaproteobacteria bacterium]